MINRISNSIMYPHNLINWNTIGIMTKASQCCQSMRWKTVYLDWLTRFDQIWLNKFSRRNQYGQHDRFASKAAFKRTLEKSLCVLCRRGEPQPLILISAVTAEALFLRRRSATIISFGSLQLRSSSFSYFYFAFYHFFFLFFLSRLQNFHPPIIVPEKVPWTVMFPSGQKYIRLWRELTPLDAIISPISTSAADFLLTRLAL